MWKIFFILLIAKLYHCQLDKNHGRHWPRIVNGIDAHQNRWPFMAALGIEINHDFHFHCGASILDSCNILTAAHCITLIETIIIEDYYNKSQMVIYFSSYELPKFNKESRYSNKNIIVHPEFDIKLMTNDIAIIQLDRQIDFKTSNTTCLTRPKKDDTVLVDKCVVLGWGKTSSNATGENVAAAVLQELFVPVLDDAYCNERTDGYNPNTTLCAGYPQGGRDSCQGDSGGPLLCAVDNGDGINYKFTLHAIVSYGDGCATPGNPGYYTKVNSYWQWIDDNRQKS